MTRRWTSVTVPWLTILLPCPSASRIIRDQGPERHVEALAAVEEGELDDRARPGNLGADLAQQLDRGIQRAAGGQQVVEHDHALARRHRALLDLDRIGAV